MCAASVRKFNQLAAELDNTVVLCISADLPFAQSRFCGAEGLSNVVTLSTLRGASFLADYGVAIATGPLAGLAARAVVVIDENDQVVYSQLVNEITEEPDYDAALAALKADNRLPGRVALADIRSAQPSLCEGFLLPRRIAGDSPRHRRAGQQNGKQPQRL